MNKNDPVIQRLENILAKYRLNEQKMADPSVIANPKEYRKVTIQHKEMEPIVEAFEKYKEISAELEEYRQVLNAKDEDPELIELAKESIPDLKEQAETGYFDLQRLLLPKDPMDGKNAILEIRAGTGGEEAALFAAEMFRAYTRFAESKRFKVNVTNYSETGVGGVKEAVAVIEGENVFSTFKYESGTHRVQRVPQTESQGRVHTSAITVAVLAEAEEIDVHVEEKDLRVDSYRSSGAGGQHVNTTDSAIRITHIPTGIVVTCQDERSKIKNQAKAMRILRAQLYDNQMREQQEGIAAERRNMVGSGDRSEKIRTYNFPQGRVTDHRVKVTIYALDSFMNGEMSDLIEQVRTRFEAQRIEEQFGKA